MWPMPWAPSIRLNTPKSLQALTIASHGNLTPGNVITVSKHNNLDPLSLLGQGFSHIKKFLNYLLVFEWILYRNGSHVRRRSLAN